MGFNYYNDFDSEYPFVDGSDNYFVWEINENYNEKKRMYQHAVATIGANIGGLKKYKTKEELKLSKVNRELVFHFLKNY
ncbi:hypothetical protein QFZ28_005909 [Neobacillus niacini]|uniref:hypothetical protein n=1 Tax=Neobacillus niacini TaxID=86668 RepID=UPI002783814F|nr:hypothetical protein [Neobacillus niacini]MDQ1005331.1 hypothetical protein [Neobacillus niacini]